MWENHLNFNCYPRRSTWWLGPLLGLLAIVLVLGVIYAACVECEWSRADAYRGQQSKETEK